MKKYQITIATLLASFFWVGYLKPFSATWGSLAAGIVLYNFWPNVTTPMKIVVILAIFLLGWFLSNYLEKQTKKHDPYFIVIDEVVGMMIATAFLPQTWSFWIVTFTLFRVFDIGKIWPASFFDERRGGFAVMFDDVIAAFYTLVVLEIMVLTLV